MPEATEKITVNISVVDLGKIDVLVDQGFYANRTDFVKDSIRRGLEAHGTALDRVLDRLAGEGQSADDGQAAGESGAAPKVKRSFCMGAMIVGRRELEEYRRRGEKVRLVLVGLLVIGSDVTPELLEETIDSVTVYGSIKGNVDALEAMGRLRRAGRS